MHVPDNEVSATDCGGAAVGVVARNGERAGAAFHNRPSPRNGARQRRIERAAHGQGVAAGGDRAINGQIAQHRVKLLSGVSVRFSPIVCVFDEKFVTPPAIVNALPESENDPAAPSKVIAPTLVKLLLDVAVWVDPLNTRLLPLAGALLQLVPDDQFPFPAAPFQIGEPVIELIQVSFEAMRVEYADAGPDSATQVPSY